MKNFQNYIICWINNTANLVHTSEMYSLKWLISCHANVTSEMLNKIYNGFSKKPSWVKVIYSETGLVTSKKVP